MQHYRFRANLFHRHCFCKTLSSLNGKQGAKREEEHTPDLELVFLFLQRGERTCEHVLALGLAAALAPSTMSVPPAAHRVLTETACAGRVTVLHIVYIGTAHRVAP
eukprot:3934666-Rhodomonas_salina.5